ncbi:hypothetical protein NY08_3054 [Rhodococcus sp. B7740]|nr:hypothetical protein NY08_3054 [Rhodococcus sp. B7740]
MQKFKTSARVIEALNNFYVLHRPGSGVSAISLQYPRGKLIQAWRQNWV